MRQSNGPVTSQHPNCAHSSAAITVADNMQQHLCVTCQVLPSTNKSKDSLQADLTMRKGPNVELAFMSGFGHDVCAFAKPQPACAPASLACSKACACSQTCWRCICCTMPKCFKLMLQQDCLQLFHHSSIQMMPWACMTGSMDTVVHFEPFIPSRASSFPACKLLWLPPALRDQQPENCGQQSC